MVNLALYNVWMAMQARSQTTLIGGSRNFREALPGNSHCYAHTQLTNAITGGANVLRVG